MPDFGSRWKPVEKEPLGRGGQGQAFLVTDTNNPTGPKFVAKVLSGAKLTEKSPRWKRLEEEIEISKSFDHPNVIRVIDSGQTKRADRVCSRGNRTAFETGNHGGELAS